MSRGDPHRREGARSTLRSPAPARVAKMPLSGDPLDEIPEFAEVGLIFAVLPTYLQPMPSLMLALVVAALALVTPGTAHAYLDAGTGSMLLQGIVAGAAAGALMLKMYWASIKARLFGRTDPDEAATSEAAGDEPEQ